MINKCDSILKKISVSLVSIFKWLVNPIVVFVTLQIVWLAITIMWVFWFVESIHELAKIAEIVGSTYFQNHHALLVLVVGCILLGMLFVGTLMLFVIGQKQSYLMHQQKRFVSSVTHELRSPLASLQLAFETLKCRNLSLYDKRKMLEIATEDTERLKRLVDNILVSSRLDRGLSGFSDAAEPINLKGFLHFIIEKIHWLEPNASGRIEVSCPEALVLYAPNPVLSLIISNLIENALKYSPASTPIKVVVTCCGERITIAIQDRGLGLLPGDKKRVFHMFHRATLTQKMAIPGTGLGLYIVKSLTKNLGGYSWAESPGKNQGSTFYVSLPISQPNG